MDHLPVPCFSMVAIHAEQGLLTLARSHRHGVWRCPSVPMELDVRYHILYWEAEPFAKIWGPTSRGVTNGKVASVALSICIYL